MILLGEAELYARLTGDKALGGGQGLAVAHCPVLSVLWCSDAQWVRARRGR